jgi:hypothetical protein
MATVNLILRSKQSYQDLHDLQMEEQLILNIQHRCWCQSIGIREPKKSGIL